MARRPNAVGLALGLVLVLSGCGGGTAASRAPSAWTPTLPSQTNPMSRCAVGVSWENFSEWRWQHYDGPALQNALQQAGGSYNARTAAADGVRQAADVDDLVASGAQVLIIQTHSSATVAPAIRRALDAGIPVIAYDQFIEDGRTLFVSFDMTEAGRLEARAVLGAAPKGRYAIFNGPANEPDAQLLRAGIHEVLAPAVARGDIQIASETYAKGWYVNQDPSPMASVLVTNRNNVQAVVAQNDNMAQGIVTALEGAGLAGKIPVSGADAEPEGLNRVARGLQTVDVWRNTWELARAAASAAMQLCASKGDLTRVTGTSQFTTPKKTQLTSILLEPVAVTRENLGDVLATGWVGKPEVCAGVDAESAPRACR